MSTRVKLSELTEAFDWVSVTGPFENAARIDRASGRIWLVSDFGDAGEEPPQDIDDDSLYLSVPGKSELDLGRNLALGFARDRLPENYEQVYGYFGKSGAYGRFKRLLDDTGHLEAWYAFEAQGVERALRAWAADNAIDLV